MAGRRLLCQTLNAEYAAKGVHVVHIVIDGAVDAPDTLGKMLGAENFEALREAKGKDKDGLLLPEEIWRPITTSHSSIDPRGPTSLTCGPILIWPGGTMPLTFKEERNWSEIGVTQ